MVRPLVCLVCLLAVVGPGCAPSVSPLYRDFAPEGGGSVAVADSLMAQLRAAVHEAGWVVAEPAVPNVLTTERRTTARGLLSRTTVALDIVPIGGRHVRVLFHPRREYVTGARTKIPYLDGGLRRQLLPPLREAFESAGLVLIEEA